jgi:hypothetical protein
MHMANQQLRQRIFQTQVEILDQNRLNTLFAHERAQYNQVIDCLESRTRSMPDVILQMTPGIKQLFREVLASGQPWTKLQRDWPLLLKKVCGDLKDFKLHAQHDLMLQEITRRNWSVLPQTKRRMMWSMLDFYQDQARIFAEPQHSDVLEVSYKVPPSNLNRMDERLKRHAQVARSDVRIVYVPDLHMSEIHTSLTHKPLCVHEVNLNHLKDWDLMLVRQEGGRYVDYQTPWFVEFKSTQGKYLLKAIDIGGRNSP